ncbi:MAG: CoA transferase [Acidimicrobiaceae bacterium]|nr:CoA transferase [Acidimicrobiaceae bacterium]
MSASLPRSVMLAKPVSPKSLARLRSLAVADGMTTDEMSIAWWAGSGAMALTGRPDGPPNVAPAAIAASASAAASDLAAMTSRWGRGVVVDGPALLGERAALSGFSRQGSTSVGGACRFVKTADGHVALNLARPEDVASLPALVEADLNPDDWPSIAARLAVMSSAVVVERSVMLGLAASTTGDVQSPVSPAHELSRGIAWKASRRPLVIDMTSLWAGPLAGSLLALGGARVIKVEGKGRPDGARCGPAPFFDLLNYGKEMIEIDFDSAVGRDLLVALVTKADLVIEGSRPRVMNRLDIDPTDVANGGTSWLSITAHGREGHDANRIGFGDDAAVAGGLVVPGEPPMFVADAVADPLTGLVAAGVAAEMLGADHTAVVETPLARVAAWARGPEVRADVIEFASGRWAAKLADERVVVAPPRSRPIAGPAATTDADGASLRREFGA